MSKKVKEINKIDDISFDELDIEIDFNIENIKMDEILDKGFKWNVGLFSYLKQVRKELGFKNIFHDKSELIFLGIILVIAFSLFGLQFNESIENSGDFTYKFKAYIFTTAPIFYFIICSYSFVSSTLNGTYELQATSKYNFYNLTAIRMFVFSILATVINTGLILGIFLFKRNFNVLEVITVSISSLFIFSIFYILVLINLKGRMGKYIAILVWLLIAGITVLGVNNDMVQRFLDVPIYIHIIVTIITISIYIKNLTKLIKVKRGEI